jgi:hypothetical protein
MQKFVKTSRIRSKTLFFPFHDLPIGPNWPFIVGQAIPLWRGIRKGGTVLRTSNHAKFKLQRFPVILDH